MPEILFALVPASPLLASLIIGIRLALGCRGEAHEKTTSRLALGAGAISLAVMAAFILHAAITGSPGQIRLGNWLESGPVTVAISFTLDRLGLAMGGAVALLALLVTRFSVAYMHREAGFHRFFAILSLFTGAMLLIVTAGNAVLVFVGWELAGLSSYLLIGYALERPAASVSATRAFVTNRFGDAGFITGIGLSFLWAGGVEWPELLDGIHRLGTLQVGLIAGGFAIAALAKSAQMPFLPWIARALEGPTPSSAVFYGSLMVHAGIYLLIRLEPMLRDAPALMVALTASGLATFVYALLSGWVQTDVKSSLMFSTQGQVGLMVLACGLGLFTLASVHLLAHAAWRLYQFLTSPSILHATTDPAPAVPRWIARSRWAYTAALRRLWQDGLTEALIVRPTGALARDVQMFDERQIDRMIGLPGIRDGESDKPFRARGALGRLLQYSADSAHRFEERLLLATGGEGLMRVLRRLGYSAVLLDRLAAQPKYLILLIVLTFVVIL